MVNPILAKDVLPRRVCPVIFLLDTSGSMGGKPIGAVNAAIEGILPELVSMNKNNADTEIAVAILTFDSATKWVTGADGLVDPEKFSWASLDASGVTSMGAAFKDLNNALSKSHGFMKSASGSVAPVLFLLSDGEPTDTDVYAENLQKLQNNNWYKVAVRVAVGYGDSNDAILEEFTKNRETVLHTNDPNDLRKLIKFVAITSSMIASGHHDPANASADQQAQDDMTNTLAAQLAANPPSLNTTDSDW